MPSQSVNEAAKQLAARSWTIAFAESATAGRAAAEFALTEYSGAVFKGAIVCYDLEVKERVLGIDPELIKNFTPESVEVTNAVAASLSRLIPSDISIAITGLTTPGGSETENKPVGTMFIHIIYPDGRLDMRKVFSGSAEHIILQTIDLIAEKLILLIGSAKQAVQKRRDE